MAVFRVEKNKNYTVMSNHHLKDKNLTLKSKGLLSVVLSLPEEWNYTVRGLAAICKEGVDCIGAALRELETAGYLKRKKLRDDRGRITDTEYVIYEFPQAKPYNDKPDADKPDTDKPDTPLPHTGSPDTEKPYMDEPPTENPAQYNTNINKYKKELNTDLLNIHQSIPPVQPSYPQKHIEPSTDRIDKIDSFDIYREIIKDNIDYAALIYEYDEKTIDEIVEIMLDSICVKRDYIHISGADYPAEVVKSRLLKLDMSHIEYVIGCIKDNTTKVRNIKAYMLTTLYNAPTTIDAYYTTLVNHDTANGFKKKPNCHNTSNR